jgi:RNA polymerase sigma-70 factor (ECF subfamily)
MHLNLKVEAGAEDIFTQKSVFLRQSEGHINIVVVLSYFEELSLEEIAQIEECPVGTVKSRIFRGKQILRQILEKENVL